MNIIFWSVLAGFYLVLSIVTVVFAIPILRSFNEIVKAGVGFSLHTENGKNIWIENLFIRAFKAIIVTDIIGFILAAAAAGVTAIYP